MLGTQFTREHTQLEVTQPGVVPALQLGVLAETVAELPHERLVPPDAWVRMAQLISKTRARVTNSSFPNGPMAYFIGSIHIHTAYLQLA